MNLLSIVIPVYCNQDSLRELHDRLNDVSVEMAHTSFEFVFVDDGSDDDSYKVLIDLSNIDNRVKVVKLTRNFGAFVACTAGLHSAKGNCAVIIAADLQDPPELIPELFSRWENGNTIVCAVRTTREDNKLRILFSRIYYGLVRLFALSNIPKEGFDFLLIDRVVIDLLNTINEKHTSLMGLIVWSGYQRVDVSYTKEKRQHGKSKWSFEKKLIYFIDTFFSFGHMPLRFISILGLLVAGASFVFLIVVLIQKYFYGIPVEGFTTLLVTILFTSGFQMIMLGIVCEYVWRGLEETRRRPLYVVEELTDGSSKQA